MSSSTATSTTQTSQLTPQQQQQLTEQLLHLKQQQQLQQEFLFRQYQEQQEYLRQQQKRELHKHLERKPTQKAIPGSTLASFDTKSESDICRKEKSSSINEPVLQRAKKDEGSSHSVSSEVKQRLQEFVLNKQQREAALASASVSQDRFRQWYATSAMSGGSEDDDFPLRKAASEPNLKLRSRLRHKVASKRTISSSSPLMFRRREKSVGGHSPVAKSFPGDPFCDSPTDRETSPLRDAEKRLRSDDRTELDTYNGSREYTHQPLFGSPSLPNIPLSGNRSNAHLSQGLFPGYSSGSSPNLMSRLRSDHPYYPHLLWSEYLANQHLLTQILAFHGKDSKDLPEMLAQRVPSEIMERTNGLSPNLQQERVKAMISAQYQILSQYHTTIPLLYPGFGHVPSSAGHGYHKYSRSSTESTSKGGDHQEQIYGNSDHDKEKLSPIATITQLQMMQQKHAEDLLMQQQAFLQHTYHMQLQEMLKQRHDSSLLRQKDHASPRMLLKEHLMMQQKEKQAANAAAGMAQVSLKEHFKRLERQNKEVEEEDEYVSVDDERSIDSKPIVPHDRLIGDDHEEIERSLELSRKHFHAEPHREYNNAMTTNMPDSIPYNSPTLARVNASPVFPVHKKTIQGAWITGIVYDTLMLKHQCSCGDTAPHPEHPGRLQSIWARLQEIGFVARCERIRPRKATVTEIQTVHSEQHTLLYSGGTIGRKQGGIQSLKCFSSLPCGGLGVDADTIWNEAHSASAARMAAGCVIDLSFKVATGEIKNGFAIVRPPGHHAEAHQAMGFCYFNNVAIAARLLRMKVAVERVLILDWDIHHGNGTQQMFYDDDHVLYVSIHRHDDGMFFPGTGKPEECGAGIGIGHNVNIALSGGLDPPIGDPEYLSAFRTLVLPITKEFNPDIILVSAGFDAAAGHSPQLGGYFVTPQCYAYMTKTLMEIANGRVVLSLEGGYNLPSLCDAAEGCMRALLGDEVPDMQEESLTNRPNSTVLKSLERIVDIQSKFWPCIKRSAGQMDKSHNDAKRLEKEEAETVNALASLSMQGIVQGVPRINKEEPMEQN